MPPTRKQAGSKPRLSRRVRTADGSRTGSTAEGALSSVLKLAREKGRGGGCHQPRLPFNVNEADRGWVDGKCRSSDRLHKALTSPVRSMALATVCTSARELDAPNFDTAMDRVRGKPGWTVHTLDCGHDVMVDMPAELTDLLEQAAA